MKVDIRADCSSLAPRGWAVIVGTAKRDRLTDSRLDYCQFLVSREIESHARSELAQAFH
jgi:hypothetical protein